MPFFSYNFLKIKKTLNYSEIKFNYLTLCSKKIQIFIVYLQKFYNI